MSSRKRHGRNRRRSRGIRTLAGLLAFALGMGLLSAVALRGDPPAPRDTKGVILPIHGMITDVMADGLQRRMDDAIAAGAEVLIFELDTPGGLVTSALRIADMIKKLADVKTVAWVNTTAHSGGAMLAVACNEIVMARSSRIGDSQVIMGGPGGAQAVPEDLKAKAYTPVLAEFRASARLNGYSQVLSEAFVLPDREVWWLEHVETGEREFVFREEKMRRLGEFTQSVFAKPESDEPAEIKWKLAEKYYDVLLQREVEAIQPVVRDDQLLEMSPSEAYAYGFCKTIVSDEKEISGRYGLAALGRIEPNWSEALAYWLTSMYVRGFLLVIIMLGAYVEFHTPGVGIAGLAALIALAIFVGAPYLTGLANIWEILLIVLGTLLLALEILVIPGFGVPGVSGLVLILLGVLFSFAPDEPGRSFPIFLPSMESTAEALKRGLAILVGSMAVSMVGMVMLRRYLPQMPYFNRLVPANPTPADVVVEDPYRGAAQVGDIGMTITPLRPGGKARLGTMVVDVVAEGAFLEQGTTVEVIERRGNRVVVREAQHGFATET